MTWAHSIPSLEHEHGNHESGESLVSFLMWVKPKVEQW